MKSMTRAEFLKLMGMGALGLAGGACGRLQWFAPGAKAPKRKPNIVFFLIDDMGWMDLSCQGSKFYKTPNIDRLASQGMTFTDAYAAAPLCSPTRASCLTGKSPARLHLTAAITYQKGKSHDTKPAEEKNGSQAWAKLIAPGRLDYLSLDETTIAEELKRIGYKTGFFGKWHLGTDEYFPEHHGFDVNFGGTHNPSPPSYFYPYKIKNITTGEEGEYITDRLTDESVKFMEENKDNPFLLYFSHYAVHGPWQGKKELIAKYEPQVDPNAGQRNPVYAAMIESVDESVGRIMDSLDELGLAEDTFVLFMSDNGGLTCVPGGGKNAGEHITSNAPLRGGKAMIYEGGIREPMFARWPGVIEEGSECSVPVITDDFYPTFLEIAGGTPSPEKILDGESLMPLLTQSGGLKRDHICFHFPHYIVGYQPDPAVNSWWNTPSSAIRKGDYKLIRFHEGWSELYNLREDIGETTNLAGKMPGKAVEMQADLDKYLKDTGAWMPLPNPRYDPKALIKEPKKK